MAHQINLLQAARPEPRRRPGSADALWALAAALGISVAVGAVLERLGNQATVQAVQVETALGLTQARAGGASSPASPADSAELARLRELAGRQSRVRAALEASLSDTARPYSGYFLALSRQSLGNLWLTHFKIGADGQSLEIGGRMTDPGQLPAYLRRLDAEPLFAGRQFAQLSLNAVQPAAAADLSTPAAYVEFVLRANVGDLP